MRRCGYCYGKGHNRRNCPELKKEIRENPDGYYARQERQKAAHRKNNPRKCSYCRKPGHTKPKCTEYKSDLTSMTLKIQLWREKFIQSCKKHGLGIGTLVAFADPSELRSEWAKNNLQGMIDRHGKYGVVTGFSHLRLDHKQEENAHQCLKIRFPDGSSKIMRLPLELASVMEERSAYTLYIAAKIRPNNIEGTFTPEWHKGTDTADWHLDNPHRWL